MNFLPLHVDLPRDERYNNFQLVGVAKAFDIHPRSPLVSG